MKPINDEEKRRIYLDDLPDQSEDQVGSSSHDILSINVDDIAPNGAGRVEHEGVVFRDLHGVISLLVDGALINGVWDSVVDQFAEEDSIAAGLE